MDKPQDKLADKIDILVIEDDPASQTTLRQILDSDDWRVHTVQAASQAFQALATGNWTLVIANVAVTDFATPLYATLRELALAPPSESGKACLRVLFLVPESSAAQARPKLESERLPYLLKPFLLHELLERVSDLLMEASAISAPIRRVRQEGLAVGRRDLRMGRNASPAQGRNTSMFAGHSDYSMTEEEMAEYERQENEEAQRKKKKKLDSF